MDDDHGLELSLGLSCGGSNGKLKGKDGGPSDVKTEEGGNSKSSMSDLKNFLNTSMQKRDAEDASQGSDASQSGLQTSKESFFTNLANSGPIADASADLHVSSGPQFTRYGEQWVASSKSPEVEEVKFDRNGNGGKMWLEGGNKRKMLFEELNRQKKQEREFQYTDAHGKKSPMVSTSMRTSHVPLTNEDGSTADNEDVAESEVDGSASGLILSHEDGTKHYMGGGRVSSEVSNERYGQKQSNPPLGTDPRLGSITYGTSMTPMNVQYPLSSKMSTINGEPNTSRFPSSRMVQMISPASNERPGSQTNNHSNLPLTFGYSPVQLPILNTERSWVLASHPMQTPPPHVGRDISSGVPNSDRSEDGSNISRGVVQPPPHSDERNASELTKGGGKQHASEEGGTSSSSPAEDETKGNSRSKEGYHVQQADGPPPLEGSAIRPGIASGLKIGGSGNYPDLPWVSTTGPGPNGRTISGVTYRYDKNQIRIVCACHGIHLSPDEFVHHAGVDQPNPENISHPNGNSGAPGQS